MNYSELLSSYIESSGLTLDQIVDRCKQRGVEIHPTYISKLRKGLRPAPSEEISKALAESLGQNPDDLILAGHLERTPTPIAEKHFEHEEVLNSIILPALEKLKNNDELLRDLLAGTEQNVELGDLRSLLDSLSIADQLKWFTEHGLNIVFKENLHDPASVEFRYDADQNRLIPKTVLKTNLPKPDDVDNQFPNIMKILRRDGKKITPEREKLIAKIIQSAVEED